MRILISNDDGINAGGIQTLAKRLSKEHEVVIVAPMVEQSGVSYSVTYRLPLFVKQREIPGFDGKAYEVDGKPVDCVKLGLRMIEGFRPDLVVTGINHGSNIGVDIYPSGTVNAAIAAVHDGLPAIAVSMTDFFSEDFEATAEYAARLVNFVQEHPIPKGLLLNLNVPPLPLEEIKGMKVVPLDTRQFKMWYQPFENPMGRRLLWLVYDYSEIEESRGYTDRDCVAEGYASVTPIRVDATSYEYMKELEKTGYFEE